jgi:predicted nucleic acid-binding protein
VARRVFIHLTCAEHLDELRATLNKPRVADLIKPYKAGRNIAALAEVKRPPDPNDDYLLAVSEAGQAGYLLKGDKIGLLLFGHHKATRIVSASRFAAFCRRRGHPGNP